MRLILGFNDLNRYLQVIRHIDNGTTIKRRVCLMDHYEVPVPDWERIEAAFT